MNIFFSLGRAALPWLGRMLPWAALGYEWGSVKEDAASAEPTGSTKAKASLLGLGLISGALLVALWLLKGKRK